MKFSSVIYGLILIASCNFAAQAGEKLPLYKNKSIPVEDRITDLISSMTLEEKVFQLNQYILGNNNNVNNEGAVEKIPAEIGSLIYFGSDPVFRNEVQRKAMTESRLGIPILFGFDVIHGFRTIYPIPLAQACSWNTELVEQACAVAAGEARSSGVDWTFSPMVDVARDGRWGRVAEGYGEDPYTNAVFGVASIKGYQGNDLSNPKNIAACLKHYVGYGASEGGRDYIFSEISSQTLWDTYMLPFEEGVKAGAATVMSAFNDISGVPASANRYILTEILKERWQHEGFVVSDWAAIRQLRNQGVVSDLKEATEKAFLAGIDMDMMNSCYDKNLITLVEEGKVPLEAIDQSVRRILRLKFKLGLFDNPYTTESQENDRFLLPESRAISEKLAEESIVLLKNNHNILPLTSGLKIALIGPMAQEKEHLFGSWSAHGKAEDVISIYEGMMSELADKVEMRYAKGCDFEGNEKAGYAEAVEVAIKSDIIILCLGEKKTWSGENASRSTLALPGIQEELVLELAKTNKPIILVLSSGRPVELSKIETYCDAIIEMWQPGIAGGKPVSGVLSGRVNPSGKLAMTFPYATGQIPIYYNMRKSGRPNQGKYQDIPATPLYEFAYGLSYTTFEYGEIKTTSDTVKRNERITVEIPVTNTGTRDGAETVHWFISDPVCSISRPVKELKHFEKQFLKIGETKVFRFEIDPIRDLGYIDGEGKRFLEAGEFTITVGSESVDIELIDTSK